MDYNVVREQCETCLSYNYIDNNVENLGYEAFECWNCHNCQFLPDEGLFRFMDRMCVDEEEAIDYKDLYRGNGIITVDGRSTP